MDKSKMSNLISINVQEIEPAQSVHHSARTKTVSYLVSSPDTITTYRHDLISANIDKSELDDVRDYFEVRQLKINTDYKETHNNRNIKKDTKLYQEAVISFGREKFENCAQSEILKLLENFSDNFENKYGCKVLMTSLHLDEGHKSPTGEIKYNYHAHVLIENYSFETHKTCLQKLDYRKLQTDLAKDFEHLGFERGKDYKTLQQAENQLAKEEHRKPKRVKPVRLEHREYREMKESQSELELENIQLKDTIKKIEQPQANHAQLKTDNAAKELQILQLHEQLRLAKEQYDADRKKLKDSGEAKQADYQKLKLEYDQTKLELEEKKVELQKVEMLQTEVLILKNERITKEFESFKPTYPPEDLEFVQEIESTFNSLTLTQSNPISDLFSSKMHEIITHEDPDRKWKETKQLLTTKQVKLHYALHQKNRILAIDKLEHRLNDLSLDLQNTTQVLEKTSNQLAHESEKNVKLIEENTEFKKNINDLNRQLEVQTKKINILESTSGLDSQQLQGQILSQDSKIQYLENGNKAFAANLEKQETENRELKKDKSELFAENYHLKIENTELKTALERFLDTPIVKRITEVSGTLLERLKGGLEGVIKQFDNHETEKQELKEELELQKETNSNLSEEVESLKSTLDDNEIYYPNRRRNNEMEM